MFFFEMQTAHAADEHRWVGIELITLAIVWVGIAYAAQNRITQVDLPIQHLIPRGRHRIFKVSHKDFHIRVQCINHHFAIGWPRDLYATILQIVWNAENLPASFTDIFGFRKKIR
ncbi:Uncharacterised protein [Vibrio cholerae]|nr:Uncharacterised protein [Vibrio cholerae]CSB46423.1 Uncharacterised protein [Vibrio cholerae]CSC98174.1 Uncharacterised protein [Vibrio cholerae]CSC99320.1 Uncharacterised protein [Vibrio cholerae]CSI81365.1 Uncharacterised protein [Vibrio cholerae]